MNKHPKKEIESTCKLRLSRDTLHRLTAEELDSIRGGADEVPPTMRFPCVPTWFCF